VTNSRLAGLSYITLDGYLITREDEVLAWLQDRVNDAVARDRGIGQGRLFTPKQVAEFLNVSEQHVINLIRAGELQAVKVGVNQGVKAMLRIKPESLDTYLAENRALAIPPARKGRGRPRKHWSVEEIHQMVQGKEEH